MSQTPSSNSQDCVCDCVCVYVCVWWWTASEGANAWMCACSCAHATLCSHVSQQMLPEASALSPVMCCPLTFSNIWGCCSLLVKDSTLLWLIMTLRLALICLNSRSAIWHLHDISIYVLASRLTLHCVELVGMTPVRQRGRCHTGRSHRGLGEAGGTQGENRKLLGHMLTCCITAF